MENYQDTTKKSELKSIKNAMILPFIFAFIMFVLQVFENEFHASFNKYGLIPRTEFGLIGIITSPFLHASYAHLFSNIFPFFFLFSLLIYSYRKIAFPVFIQIYLWTGILAWISAREGNHIGASGIIYGLSSFLALIGLLRRDIKSMAIAFLVIFLYGSLVWGVFPSFLQEKNISWESHLWGMITGFILAYFYRKTGVPEKPAFENEEDDDNDDEYWKLENPENEEPTVKINYYFPNGMKR
ncbi:MAG: rhomboid family intramembrane serine protease [Bacteroidota bacterium]